MFSFPHFISLFNCIVWLVCLAKQTSGSTETNKKSHLKWGDKKGHAIKRNGRILTIKAKWNGGNLTLRYRIQNNGDKDVQGTYRKL